MQFRHLLALGRRSWVAVILVAVVCLVPSHPRGAAAGRTLYAAPNGAPGNDGSAGRPYDLATALSGGGQVQPGDTLWLRAGTYRGPFTSWLNGTSSAPIIVRAYPGERVTIDGANNPGSATFIVNGSWTTYWGLEIMNSSPNRLVDLSQRGTGLDIYGANTKFINNIVHDAQTGIGFWTPAVNAELYGNIVYNNGIDYSDRGHGHSIYVQNQSGTKRIADNILFNSFSFGIHAYTSGGNIDNITMEGNVAFNHGILSAISGMKSDMLLGGGRVANNAVLTQNHFYNTPGFGGRAADIGYQVGCSNTNVQQNIFVSDTAVNFNCSSTTFANNSVYGWAGSLPSQFPNNTYYSSRPGSPWVIVRPNQYEPGRGNVIIYNWTRQSQVGVDLSQAGISVGDQYEIRDAQNYFNSPVMSGTYGGGQVQVPMTGLSVARPIGNAPIMPPHTGPDFGVFVVSRPGGGGSTTPSVSATISASPTTIQAGQATTISWSTTNAATVSISPSIGTVSASGSVAMGPTSTTTYTLTASNSQGSTTQSVTVNVTAAAAPPPSGGPGSASFVGNDSTTQGMWQGTYGGGGSAQPYAGTQLPSYASLSLGGQSPWQWTSLTRDARGLLTLAGTSRTAGTWYAAGSFDVDLNITDGASHRVAFYSVDWDGLGRAQTVQVFDGNGALLNTQTMSSFTGGQYLVWNMSGRVKVRFTRTAGPNAVLSGIFFDGGGSTGSVTPPTGQPAPSGGTSAAFLGVDSTTKGAWTGVYGSTGASIPLASMPAVQGASVKLNGGASWLWTPDTLLPQALQMPGRLTLWASTWYDANELSIEVNVTDGGAKRVALYALDFDNAGRGETIDVIDTATGALLDQRTLATFQGGTYVAWKVTGSVTFRVRRTAGPNAVISAAFVDPA